MIAISQLAANYKNLVDAILDSGPLVNDNLEDVKVIVDRVQAIRDRTIAHFTDGVAGAGDVLTEEQIAQLVEEPRFKQASAALAGVVGVSAEGNKGPFGDLLLQILQLAISNPQFLLTIIQLFKKPA